METINWQPLDEIEPGTPGVYLIEWSDGVVKYGKSQNIERRTQKHLSSKEKRNPSSTHTGYAAKIENRRAAEQIIHDLTGGGDSEWISSKEFNAQEIKEKTEGKEVPEKETPVYSKVVNALTERVLENAEEEIEKVARQTLRQAQENSLKDVLREHRESIDTLLKVQELESWTHGNQHTREVIRAFIGRSLAFTELLKQAVDNE